MIDTVNDYSINEEDEMEKLKRYCNCYEGRIKIDVLSEECFVMCPYNKLPYHCERFIDANRGWY